MRIRYATKGQPLVRWASRVEKHTMQDGTIPLFGLSLSVVCRQWGSYVESGGWNSHNFPVAFTNNCFAVITNLQTPTDNYTGGPGTSIPCVKAITKKNFICNVNGGSGWRVQYIAIGNQATPIATQLYLLDPLRSPPFACVFHNIIRWIVMPVLLCFEITYPVSNELVRDIGEAKTLNTVPKETGNWIVPLPFPHC